MPLEPGIYFGLDESEYHSDPALGSTDLRRLLRSAPDYWWHSSMNPHRPSVAATEGQLFGRAIHKLVLEGEKKFHSIYQRRPDDEPGATPAQKAANTKAAKARLAPGQELVHGDDYDRILISSAMITKNPDLATAFEGGMPEVSVFFDLHGVRCKARYDYLKVRGIGDLKSIRNSLGTDFVSACRRHISSYRYDIQGTHYLDARKEIPLLLSAGAVHGDHDPAWLKQVAKADAYGFAWVFFQAEDAPITWAASLSPKNPICGVARIDIKRAIETYKDFMARFGKENIWLMSEPVSEIDINELPGWYGRAA